MEANITIFPSDTTKIKATIYGGFLVNGTQNETPTFLL